jgi:long-subunit acyl-CoA synthetase (AMP-forming)
MVVHSACLFAGVTVVPLETGLSADEIVERVRKAGIHVLLHSMLYLEKARDVAKRVPCLETGCLASKNVEAILADAADAALHSSDGLWNRDSVDTERTAMLVFTSGTTATPRPAELAVSSIEAFCETAGTALEMRAGDRSLMLLPLYLIYGLCATYAMLANGVALGVCHDFKRILAAFLRFKVDYAFLVPALADVLAMKVSQYGDTIEEVTGNPVRWIVTGGAPISRRTYERLTSLGVKMLGAYGLTETAACYSISHVSDEPRACSAGRVSRARGVETRVSEAGELLVRGPNVMKGYYGMSDATSSVIDDEGWFHTGDYGRIDDDGYVWISGRISRTIVLSSGKKISPEELENKIVSLPGVLEALVTGDGESREIRAEIYASVGEMSVKRSVSALNATLPVYQRIDRIILRNTPFPRTASGKIKVR